METLSPEIEFTEAMHPQALHFLQLTYGLDHTLEGLTQKDALAIAYGLTEVHLPDPSQKARLRHVIGAFMTGQATDVIAQDIEQGTSGFTWPMYGNSVAVEQALSDIAATWRRYNQAARLWEEENVREDLLGGSDSDFLDRIKAKALADAPVGRLSLEADAPQDITQLASHEQLHTILQDRIDAKAEAAELAIDLYAQTPEFQEAFKRSGHDLETEVFVIGPDDTDEPAEVRRKAAWLLHRSIFLEKDGTPMESMRSIEDRTLDYHFVAVRHTDSGPVPQGSMYLKVRTADNPTAELPSLQALEKTWGKPLPQLLAGSNREHLLNSSTVADIVTVGVRKQFLSSVANPGLYNTLGKLADKLGITDFVTIFDEPAERMLNRYYEAFKKYAPESVIPRLTYDAPRGQGANWSLPLHCNIPLWKANLTPAKLAVYFGDRLASRIRITNV